MTIFVTSSIVEIRRYDGEKLTSRSEYEEVLKTFRKVADAVAFVKGYDYYSDTGVSELLKDAKMSDELIVDMFWVDSVRHTLTMRSVVDFEGNNYKIEYNLYIEERELE